MACKFFPYEDTLWSGGHKNGVELSMKVLRSGDWFVDHMRYWMSRYLIAIIGITKGMGYRSGGHANQMERSMKGLRSGD